MLSEGGRDVASTLKLDMLMGAVGQFASSSWAYCNELSYSSEFNKLKYFFMDLHNCVGRMYFILLVSCSLY